MKSALFTLVLIVTFSVAHSQLVSHYIPKTADPKDVTPGIGFYSYTPPDYNTNPSTKFPLIIALGGNGEKGNGTTQLGNVLISGIGYQINTNHATMQFSYPNGVHGSFVVLLPQLDLGYLDWVPNYVGKMVAWAKGNLNIDPNRIFVTGYSLGGGGAIIYASQNVDSARNLAGIIPISGSGIPPYMEPLDTCNIGAGRTAVWAIHTSDDDQIPTSVTRNIVNGINTCSPLPLDPVVGYYPIGNHQIYDQKIYPDTANKYLYPNVYQWMLGVNRQNTYQNNLPPVANVGSTDTTVVVNSGMRFFPKTITGVLSTDPNDLVTSYKWQIISDNRDNVWPLNGYQKVDTFTTQRMDLDYRNWTWPWQDLEFHALGTYVFRLTVTDMFGATSFVDKNIHITDNGVNVAPYISLPANINIPANAPGNTVINVAATVFDWEGLDHYSFTQISGPATATIAQNNWYQSDLTGFTAPGSYVFEVTAFDAGGLSSKASITITKIQPLPVTYLYFNGTNSDGKNILKWATSKELNNDHFDVLKSDDGIDFSPVVTIPASTAATETRQYSFTDINPFPGNNYYRLAQYDIDGTKKLSDIINIRNAGNTAIATYPNPIKDQLYFTVKSSDIKGIVKARVLDASGKVVKQMSFDKTGSISNQSIQLPGLQPGIYVLELSQDNGWQSVHRFVK
ncbi:PKD domain-containing protein [Pinibacter soli]|uniref:T9SS type A sorting domain-containing protein n=1 Tax=Pinibacter soli TaxID=3044211 RepID=A0ABT6RI84_9BACT|nr:T9SS type A sorting domain-containing protein [Pinibacter soli]MDI3322287.1 T9SS type A sorting domain-containing protein [Pinibacter soli]